MLFGLLLLGLLGGLFAASASSASAGFGLLHLFLDFLGHGVLFGRRFLFRLLLGFGNFLLLGLGNFLVLGLSGFLCLFLDLSADSPTDILDFFSHGSSSATAASAASASASAFWKAALARSIIGLTAASSVSGLASVATTPPKKRYQLENFVSEQLEMEDPSGVRGVSDAGIP